MAEIVGAYALGTGVVGGLLSPVPVVDGVVLTFATKAMLDQIAQDVYGTEDDGGWNVFACLLGSKTAELIGLKAATALTGPGMALAHAAHASITHVLYGITMAVYFEAQIANGEKPHFPQSFKQITKHVGHLAKLLDVKELITNPQKYFADAKTFKNFLKEWMDTASRNTIL
jgi:hypothetical protein